MRGIEVNRAILRRIKSGVRERERERKRGRVAVIKERDKNNYHDKIF
jgi:hypothetical protein